MVWSSLLQLARTIVDLSEIEVFAANLLAEAMQHGPRMGLWQQKVCFGV